MTLLLALGFVWLALIAFLVVQFSRAPHGMQDDQGFHFTQAPAGVRRARATVATARMRHAGIRLPHASFVR